MSGNISGKIFKVVTFGESHGPFIGLVIDGLQPGLPIDLKDIQRELDRRRPGQSRFTSARQEIDRIRVISGILDGKTTGTPLCILIPNQDQRPKDYRDLQKILRPGHASFTFLQKYGLFDYRGGGRASGRETATRVAAGAVAKQFLRNRGIEIIAYTRQIGSVAANEVNFAVIEKNPLRVPDLEAARKMEEAVLVAKEEGDSLGGIVEIVVRNLPAGLGEPVFHKLEADLAAALMSIGAVKAFEIGSGFRAAEQRGSEHNDAFYLESKTGKIRTRTNNAGGVLGGISTGDDLLMRLAVKPPSSIGKAQETVDWQGNPVTLKMKGRHDPCICPRIVPVAEAMTALVLIDHILLQERISGRGENGYIKQKIETINHQMLLLEAQKKILLGKISGGGKDTAFQKEWHKQQEAELKAAAILLDIDAARLKELLHIG